MDDRRIIDIEARLSEIENRMRYVDSDNFRPEDPQSRQKEDNERNILSGNITELTWDTHVRASSLEPHTIGFSTSASASDYDYAYLPVRTDNIVNQSRESRVRFGYSQLTDPSNSTSYLMTNMSVNTLPTNTFSSGTSFIGFKIDSGVVYGVHYNEENKETLVDLNYTITEDVYDTFELYTIPGNRTEFSINGVLRGTLAKNYPNSYNTSTDIMIPIMAYIKNTAAVAHTSDLDFYEYIQRRN